MTQIVYSTERVKNAEGRQVKNPRHFLAPVKGATKVYIAGHWPQVAAAYEKVGVPMAPIEEMRVLSGNAKAIAKPTPSVEPRQAD